MAYRLGVKLPLNSKGSFGVEKSVENGSACESHGCR